MYPLQEIFAGSDIHITHYEPVHGGDINVSFSIYSHTNRYFLKINDAGKYPGMFEKEADGLDALRKHSTLVIPDVIKQGIVKNRQYLLLSWIDSGRPSDNSWPLFGKALAEMHLHQQPYFGWRMNNYIGSLPQTNSICHDWPSFYTNCRIIPLVKQLYDSDALTEKDVKNAELLCKRFPEIFPEEPPSLVHGDLWSGNYKITNDGKAAVFDPAVYCGHREMDIGMSLLFGGFHSSFYNSYNDVYPLQKGWQHRLPFTQLYPLLVHAVLFGGHYTEEARNILKS